MLASRKILNKHLRFLISATRRTIAKNPSGASLAEPMWLTLSLYESKKKPFAALHNASRRFLARPVESEYDVTHTILTASEKVYLGVTPAGNYYVSSAEDRAHKLHEGDIPPGEGMEQKIADILWAYWKDWVAEAEGIIRDNPPDTDSD